MPDLLIKKKIPPFAWIVSGFTLAQGLLIFVIVEASDAYYYAVNHHEEQFLIYFLLIGFPLMAGMILYYHFRHRAVHPAVRAGILSVSVLQSVLFTLALFFNHQYWGYIIKRPVIFPEIGQASAVNSVSYVSNESNGERVMLFAMEDPYRDIRDLSSRNDLYDNLFNRPFLTLDYLGIAGKIWKGGLATYEDTTQKIQSNDLRLIDSLIYNSGMIVYGGDGYDSNGVVHGFVIELTGENDQSLVFAGLQGGQVSNDHYPFYEFLFQKAGDVYQLKRKHRFYTDLAGLEGMEYANLAPFLSIFILLIGALVWLIAWIIWRWKNRLNVIGNSLM